MSEKKESQNNQQQGLTKKDVVETVTRRVFDLAEAGKLSFPADYAPENALMSAWLTLQATETKDKQPVLQACTTASISNALMDMVVQGLNPAKHQCYFIAYGKALTCQRGVFGDMALVQRIHPEAQIYAEVIYQGDEVAYEIDRGKKRITKHVQKLDHVGKLDKIAGAYCVIQLPGRDPEATIMTIEQIKQSWKKSKTYGEKSATPHNEQPDQMAIRTVVRRACKPLINGSSDGYLVRAARRSDELATEAEMQEEVATHANQGVIDIHPEEPEEEESEQEAEEAKQPTAAGKPGF